MKTRHNSKTSARSATSTRNARSENIHEEIIEWLRDAYAMERGLEGALEKQSKNEDLLPEVRALATNHLEETRNHAELVKAALQALGSETSLLKTSAGIIMQTTKGIGTIFASDERIKDLLDSYSMEHFEIACYTALSAAAKRAGLDEIVQMCKKILHDEQRMAQAIIKSVPSEISAYLFEAQNEEL